ncbi:protein spaetzle-like [Sabethes cyaneus]|uniref:protein spaetzle-like n=1 Tax=Sabethes cyaneus TaxID=53552 RepID=UPI00237D9FDA|nr:protein spaetzle-like [Sabethes cyaneus]
MIWKIPWILLRWWSGLLLLAVYADSAFRFRPPSKPRDSQPLDFVFPDHILPRIDRTQCPPEFPVCTDVANYPQKLVEEIVSRHKERYAEVFGNDMVIDSGDELHKKFETSDDDFLCVSEQKLVHPQSGYNVAEKLVMIVNTPNYLQGVRIEVCRNLDRPCSKLNHLTSFFKTTCKQLYSYRTLLAIDQKTKQAYKESFRLPSCCKCVFHTSQAMRENN